MGLHTISRARGSTVSEVASEHFTVHGAKIEIRSVDPVFSEYVRSELSFFRTQGVRGKADLCVEFLGYDSLRRTRLDLGNTSFIEVLSSNLKFLGSQCFMWESPRYSLIASRDTSGTRVCGVYHERIDHTLRRYLIGQKGIRWNNTQAAARTLVHFPLFSMLQMEMGCGLLHGAVLNYGGQAVVLVGSGGAGKSTLALALARLGCELLADNYAIFREGHVLAFPETLRCASHVGDVPEALRPTGRIAYGKMQYRYTPSIRSLPVGAVVLVSRGTTDGIEELSKDGMWNSIQRMHDLTDELHATSWASHLYAAKTSLVVDNWRKLGELLDCGADLYRLVCPIGNPTWAAEVLHDTLLNS